MSRFKQATRQQSRLRMAIDGPAKSGKTLTSLRLACILAREMPGEGNGRVAVADSERGSASKYQGYQASPEEPPLDFDVCELGSFSPTEYTAVINDFAREKYSVGIVDSLSHAWAGKDGALELKDRQGGNSFTAWKSITPMHNAMVESILHSTCHMFVTMRSKIAYVMETNEHGKQVPRRIGMEPVQRAGMEYEFDLYGSMDWSHIMTVSGSRCPAVDNAIIVKPGLAFMRPVIDWLRDGSPVDDGTLLRKSRITDERFYDLVRLVNQAGMKPDALASELLKRYGVSELADLTPEHGEDFARRMDRPKRQPRPAPATTTTEPTATLPPLVTAPARETATDDQLQTLAKLKAELIEMEEMDADGWVQVLGKRNVTTAYDLTPTQADELISKLKTRRDLVEMTREPGMNPEEQEAAGQQISDAAIADLKEQEELEQLANANADANGTANANGKAQA